MSGAEQRVAIITGGSQGIGAGLVTGYRRQGWAVVANARTIKPSEDPEVLTRSYFERVLPQAPEPLDDGITPADQP